MSRLPIAIVLMASIAAPAVGASPVASAADRSFVAKVSQGGMFEVASAMLAEQKGSTQDVRDIGAMEVHDHTLVGAKLKAVSTSEDVSFAAQLNPDFTARIARLKGLSGSAFDRAYMNAIAIIHDADGAAFATEAADGGSAAYRGFANETHRIVQRHIGAIRALPLN